MSGDVLGDGVKKPKTIAKSRVCGVVTRRLQKNMLMVHKWP